MALKKAKIDIQLLFNTFHLPDQTLNQLPGHGHSPAELYGWLQPFKDSEHLSPALYKLLPEISQLTLTGERRLAIAMMLRPIVNQCVTKLISSSLEKSLPSSTITKIAAMVNALQKHLCHNYLLATRDILFNEQTTTTQTSLPLAIYFAMENLSQTIYQNYRLYTPIPELCWYKQHQLYHLAKHLQLEQSQINDGQLAYVKSMSIEQVYFRSLILACSHCNQLRPIDIYYIYRALELWSAAISLSDTNDHRDIYGINLSSDEGPFYNNRDKRPQDETQYFRIDFHALIDILQAHYLHKPPKNQHNIIEMPSHFRPPLIKHLIGCWQETCTRQQHRQPTHIQLSACIGLNRAYQTLSQQKISEAQTIEAIDSSKDGYCLKWPGVIHSAIKPGEIILLKEENEEQWCVGNIRWAQRFNSYTYVGIKVLGHHAIASKVSKGNHAESYPIILLDTEKRQTQSLIAATDSLQSGHLLHEENQKNYVELKEILFHSAFITQYQYHPANVPPQ